MVLASRDGIGLAGSAEGSSGVVGWRVGNRPTMSLGIAYLGCVRGPHAIDRNDDDAKDILSRRESK